MDETKKCISKSCFQIFWVVSVQEVLTHFISNDITWVKTSCIQKYLNIISKAKNEDFGSEIFEKGNILRLFSYM